MTPSELRYAAQKIIWLSELFRRTEAAGFGIAKDDTFEAFPGCEDAAADYIESIISEVVQ
jgi:hypothetical protein